MKFTTVFFKDLGPEFVTANYRADICTISKVPNTFYSVATSKVVEIYIQENLKQENLHLEAATQSWFEKRCCQIIGEIPGKCLRKIPQSSL